MTKPYPTDNLAYRFPVSVKGVVIRDSKVFLLRNEREEWELPGGKLERDESPEQTVVREIREELGLEILPGPVLDSWVYHIHQDVDVLIVSYGCHPKSLEPARISPEHKELGLFPLSTVVDLPMPENYKRSIFHWERLLRAQKRFDEFLCS